MIIGITGGSCSGKTSLLKQLSYRLDSEITEYISFDDYTRGLENLNEGITNLDQPEAFRINDFIHDITELKNGKKVISNVYTAAKGKPPASEVERQAKQVIIVEGFLIFCHPKTLSLFDKRIYIDLPENEIIKRRLQRSKQNTDYWDSESYILSYVIPNHKKYVIPQKEHCEYILDGRDDIRALTDRLVAIILK